MYLRTARSSRCSRCRKGYCLQDLSTLQVKDLIRTSGLTLQWNQDQIYLGPNYLHKVLSIPLGDPDKPCWEGQPALTCSVRPFTIPTIQLHLVSKFHLWALPISSKLQMFAWRALHSRQLQTNEYIHHVHPICICCRSAMKTADNLLSSCTVTQHMRIFAT